MRRNGRLRGTTVLCHNGQNASDDNTLAQCLGTIVQKCGAQTGFQGADQISQITHFKFHFKHCMYLESTYLRSKIRRLGNPLCVMQ